MARLTKELLMAHEVVHPNVCPTYDYFEAVREDSKPMEPIRFLTMRFLEGETLRARLLREGPLSASVAHGIVEQICRGLEAAHAAGVLHGDLKGSNVMLVERDGATQAVLMDFGLARTFEEGARAGFSTAVFGTPGYMAPEALQHLPLTPRSDIFSLGVLMYEMRTGRLPASASTVSLEPNWSRTIDRCLEYSPEKRPQSVSDVIAGLTAEHSPASAISMPRSSWWTAAAVIVLLSLGATPAVRKFVSRQFSHVPKIRHVALLPMESAGSADLRQIAAALDEQIAARLARVESRDPNFWIVSASDLAAQRSETLRQLPWPFPSTSHFAPAFRATVETYARR
ncbi:MAG: serine/threonine-protein kinase [Acidobacteriota bacterium]